MAFELVETHHLNTERAAHATKTTATKMKEFNSKEREKKNTGWLEKNALINTFAMTKLSAGNITQNPYIWTISVCIFLRSVYFPPFTLLLLHFKMASLFQWSLKIALSFRAFPLIECRVFTRLTHTHTTQCQPDKNDYLLFLSPQVHCSVDKAVWLVWSILYDWTMAFFFLFISLASSFACFARKTACDASCKPWFGSRFKHFSFFFSPLSLCVCAMFVGLEKRRIFGLLWQ